MTKKTSKKKMQISFILFFIILITTISAYVPFKIQPKKNPELKDKLKNFEIDYLYGYYFDYDPDIQERNFYGKKDAPIHLIAYLKINSPASKYFISEIFPQIKKEFIDKSKVKFYQKNYITMGDYNEKNDNFIFAATLYCVDTVKKSSYYPFYFDLFQISDINETLNLLNKYNITIKKFNNCIEKENFDKLKKDFIENEKLGIVGINQRFYIGIGQDNVVLEGVPKYTKFKKRIKQYQMIIGD